MTRRSTDPAARRAFDAQAALEHALRYAYPRRVGSDGELRARTGLRGDLEGIGWRVEERPFAIRRPIQALERWLILLRMGVVAVTVGVATQSPSAALPGIAVFLVTLVAPFLRPIRLLAYRRALGRARSPRGAPLRAANLVARLAGESTGRAPARLILCAHLDTKDGIPLGARLLLAWLTLVLSAAWFLGGIAAGVAHGAGPWGLLFLLGGGAVWVAHGLGLRARGRGPSPGAADNASGVGVLLELAEVLARRRAEWAGALDVVLLLTSAEELGLLGAAHHAFDMEPGTPTLVVNFDTTGLEGKTWYVVANERGGRRSRLPAGLGPDLGRTLGAICRRLAIPSSDLPILVGAAADHLPFADLGFPALTLGSFGRGLWWAHTPKDVPANLHRNGFERAGKIAEALIEALLSEDLQGARGQAERGTPRGPRDQ